MNYNWLFFLLLSTLATAQDFTDQWMGHFSFNRIVDIEVAREQVYAASDNAIFIYNTNLRDFETITTVNGLSGDQISQVFYREEADQLVIGYENGLLQIVQDDAVLDVVAIRDKQVITRDRKRINEFKINGDLLYIATDFGIAIYDLERLEFNDTYFIGDNGAQLRVQSLEIYDGFIYAATQDSGIRRAPLSDPFLIDFMNWSQLNRGSFDEVIATDSSLLAIDDSGGLYRFSNTTFNPVGYRFPSSSRDATVFNNQLVVTGSNYYQLLDNSLQVLQDVSSINDEMFEFTAGSVDDNSIYIGTIDNGLIRVNRNDSSITDFIIADGPTRNRAFSLTTSPNVLWVGYGDYTVFYNPFPLEQFGISKLSDGEWINYNPQDVRNINSIADITINPNQPEEIYLNSMHDGVLQFVDGAATTLYSVNNSSLNSIRPPSDQFVRVPDSDFDSNGNLWALNSLVPNTLNKRTPSGQWTPYDTSDRFPTLSNSSSATKMVITRAGNVIFGTLNLGVIGFDPQANKYGNLNENLSEGNLVNNYVSELTLDQNEQLWIGSNLGLRVLFNANSILLDNTVDARPIIIEDQNGIPRELLADAAVLDIEVDGNNRKWIATASAGAYLFSPSGRETIYQFTKDNSPLPSNSVNDIAIDESSGRVYFATDNGIVSFQGERSSSPSDDLESVYAFPNPVKPGFTGNVTIDGLTDRARIKITDIEGNLVNELISQGGSVPWDTNNFNGTPVSSGVYILFISTSDNIETKVTKLMIIR